MLEPLAVDPRRSVAPAANSMASARLVFPAPAGPTSAITRVPFADSPPMRLSLRPFDGRSESLKALDALFDETFTVRLFLAVCKRGTAPFQQGWAGKGASDRGKYRRTCREGRNCAGWQEGPTRTNAGRDPGAGLEGNRIPDVEGIVEGQRLPGGGGGRLLRLPSDGAAAWSNGADLRPRGEPRDRPQECPVARHHTSKGRGDTHRRPAAQHRQDLGWQEGPRRGPCAAGRALGRAQCR